jgi:hypothetical protein
MTALDGTTLTGEALRTAGAALVALEVIGMVVLAIEGVTVGIPAP